MDCVMPSYVTSMPRGRTPMAKSGMILEVPRRQPHSPSIAAARMATGRCLLRFFWYGLRYARRNGNTRHYVHVSDLADAHVRAIKRLFTGEQSIVVNLGTGHGHSIRQVVSAVEKVGGVRVPTVEAARRPGDPPTLVADPRQGQSLLGWSPSKSGLHDIIRTAWNWHTQHESR